MVVWFLIVEEIFIVWKKKKEGILYDSACEHVKEGEMEVIEDNKTFLLALVFFFNNNIPQESHIELT